MNLGLIKSGVQLLVGFGSGLIADSAVNMVKPKNLKGLKKAAVQVGGFVISAMVADKATEYVEQLWDKTAEDVKNIVSITNEEEVTEEKTEE